MPDGLLAGSSPFGCVPQYDWVAGNAFYVDSVTGNDRYDGSQPDSPIQTLGAAIGRCTANKGDVIFLMPGSAFASVADITSVDVAGTSIIGMGFGNNRPEITPGPGGVALIVTADNCRISNIVFDIDAAGIGTAARSVQIDAAGVMVDHCTVKPHATSQYTSLMELTTAGGGDCVIAYNDCHSLPGTGSVRGIYTNSANGHRMQIIGNLVYGFLDGGGCIQQGATTTETLVAYNMLHNVADTSDADVAIDMDDASTGMCVHNRCNHQRALVVGLDNGNLYSCENYVADLVDTHGVVVPVTAST
jgi:hypothetical protein